jgi:hypothetical protein
VSFIGRCERVPPFFRCLDICVQASTFEPFGVALPETKAAGVGIVATCVSDRDRSILGKGIASRNLEDMRQYRWCAKREGPRGNLTSPVAR